MTEAKISLLYFLATTNMLTENKISRYNFSFHPLHNANNESTLYANNYNSVQITSMNNFHSTQICQKSLML